MYSQLKSIIEKTNKQPTIVNPESNFVVVTYWWGRGNKNNNTARPCVAFYESVANPIINLALETLNTVSKSPIQYQKLLQNIDNVVPKIDNYKKHIARKAQVYMNMVASYCNVDINSSNRDANTLICLENYKKTGKTPKDYEYKTVDAIERILNLSMKQFLALNKDKLNELFLIKAKTITLKNNYSGRLKELSEKQKVLLRNTIKQNTDIKNNLLADIKQKMKIQITTPITDFKDAPEYIGKNILDILNFELRYLEPLTFEDMITKWENECSTNKCNYLAVEYPEFAQPGGYQLAINAKPLFIKRALELCEGRSVLYIDGDMFIRKYPSIFDIKDVDFMARGWWIDPRSSYKMEESIMYDPYTFETSGGTMFFSQSPESKLLIEKWIEEAEKPYQQGKADDRVLSLVFNSYKFLLSMKIIQLPIEYLWLTLDYDDRMMEMVYDYDYAKMRTSIFIEHPECLTTEDTAAGAGASSDRTPKFYDFLDDNLVPTSEEMHEYLMFPNKEMTSAFRDYFDFMNGIVYLDDGNDLLYQRGYITSGDPDVSESPLYITSYDNKLGNKKYPGDKTYTVNQISEINYKRARSMNIASMSNVVDKGDFVEVSEDPSNMNDAKLQSLIIRLLLDGKNVIYKPNNSEATIYYNDLINKMNTLYSNLDFVFTPVIKSFYFSDFFKPEVDYSKPILFRSGNRILIDFLSMFLSLDEVSSYLQNGSYQIMSRTRIGYLIRPKTVGGGEGDELDVDDDENPLNMYIQSYNDGLKSSYETMKQLGGRSGYRKNKKIINRTVTPYYKNKTHKKINKKSNKKANKKTHKKANKKVNKQHNVNKKTNIGKKTHKKKYVNKKIQKKTRK